MKELYTIELFKRDKMSGERKQYCKQKEQGGSFFS